MNKQKKFLVSFLILASVLVLTSVVSANQIATITNLNVNSLNGVGNGQSIAVLAGNSVPVTVTFTANANESNVYLSVNVQGINGDIQSQVFVGDIETGQTYVEPLSISIPSDNGDIQSNNLPVVVTIWNGDSSVVETQQTVYFRYQRQSYNVEVMSLNTVGSVNAGGLVPVNVVLKNTGYNELNDLYVIVSIPALNVEKTAYFGDLNNVVQSNDTTSGTVYLQLPSYNVTSGSYIVQAEVRNGYVDEVQTTTLNIENSFESNIVADNPVQSSNVGQSATYNLEVVNPTTSITVYNIVPQTASGVAISTDSIITVPAGSSRTITLTATPSSAGSYNLSVSAFSNDGQLTGNVNLALNAEGNGVSNPVVILTIVLAVIFITLLAVLLVLIARKPSSNKPEEFSESYY